MRTQGGVIGRKTGGKDSQFSPHRDSMQLHRFTSSNKTDQSTGCISRFGVMKVFLGETPPGERLWVRRVSGSPKRKTGGREDSNPDFLQTVN